MRIERIGNATLYHGNCLDILPMIEAVDYVVTDPPYGIAWKRGEKTQRNDAGHPGIIGDEDTSSRDAALSILAEVPAAVFGSFYAPFPQNVRQVLVWHKPVDSGLVGATTGFRRDAEPIFLVGPWPVVPVTHSSVLRSHRKGQAAVVKATGHPHTKPIDLVEFLVMRHQGRRVIDPFMGSGTTGVACANLGREFIGIEIDETYFNTACERVAAAHNQQRLFA